MAWIYNDEKTGETIRFRDSDDVAMWLETPENFDRMSPETQRGMLLNFWYDLTDRYPTPQAFFQTTQDMFPDSLEDCFGALFIAFVAHDIDLCRREGDLTWFDFRWEA